VNRLAYAVLLVIGVSLLAMPMSVPVFKSNSPYSVLNTGGNGLSEFGGLLYHSGKLVPVMSPYDSFDLKDMKGTLVVVGPDVPFSAGDVKQVKTFLSNGGTLLLAADSRTANGLLGGLGIPQRFSEKPVVSLTYAGDYHFPVTKEIVNISLAEGVSYVVLKEPGTVLNAEGPILYTSNATMFNGTYGRFPIIDEVNYGKGRLILVADPAMFTNALFRENRVFLQNLVSSLPGKTFYVDEVHHADFDPYSSGSIVIRNAINKKYVFYYVLFVAMLAFLVESGVVIRVFEWTLRLILRILERFSEEEPSVDEIVRRLAARGYDGDKLKNIVMEIEKGSKLGDAHGR